MDSTSLLIKLDFEAWGALQLYDTDYIRKRPIHPICRLNHKVEHFFVGNQKELVFIQRFILNEFYLVIYLQFRLIHEFNWTGWEGSPDFVVLWSQLVFPDILILIDSLL